MTFESLASSKIVPLATGLASGLQSFIFDFSNNSKMNFCCESFSCVPSLDQSPHIFKQNFSLPLSDVNFLPISILKFLTCFSLPFTTKSSTSAPTIWLWSHLLINTHGWDTDVTKFNDFKLSFNFRSHWRAPCFRPYTALFNLQTDFSFPVAMNPFGWCT